MLFDTCSQLQVAKLARTVDQIYQNSTVEHAVVMVLGNNPTPEQARVQEMNAQKREINYLHK